MSHDKKGVHLEHRNISFALFVGCFQVVSESHLRLCDDGSCTELVVFSLLDILIQRVHVDIKSNVAETLAYSPDFFLHNVGALANDHIKRLLLTVIIADKLILKRDITLKCSHISLAPCSSDN